MKFSRSLSFGEILSQESLKNIKDNKSLMSLKPEVCCEDHSIYDTKSLTSSKPELSSKQEVCCEDHLIYIPTKLKKISHLSQDHNEDRIRGALFVKESKQRLYSLLD